MKTAINEFVNTTKGEWNGNNAVTRFGNSLLTFFVYPAKNSN